MDGSNDNEPQTGGTQSLGIVVPLIRRINSDGRAHQRGCGSVGMRSPASSTGYPLDLTSDVRLNCTLLRDPQCYDHAIPMHGYIAADLRVSID